MYTLISYKLSKGIDLNCCKFKWNLFFSALTVITTEAEHLFTFEAMEYACIYGAYLLYVAVQFGTFIICAMTFDKFFAIKFPHRSVSFSTVKRTKMVIFGIFIFCIIYNIPYIFLTKLLPGPLCTRYVGKSWVSIYFWFSFAINCVTPFCLLLTFNSIIINEIRSRNKFFRNRTVNSKTSKDEGKEENMKGIERQLSLMSIMVATAFLLCMTPIYIRHILNSLINWKASPHRFAKFVLFYVVTHELYYSNSAVNFYLYCISGSKFRNDLFNIFSCCKEKPKRTFSMRLDDISTSNGSTVLTVVPKGETK